MSANEYPLDTDGLDKGSRITAEQIEVATGIKRDHRDFGLGSLKIKGYITWRLAQRGLDVVIRSDKGDLVILTDEEAAPYTDDAFAKAYSDMRRRLEQQQQVDRAALSTDTRNRHDRALVVNGATYAGAKGARAKVMAPPKARERLTPGKSS